jgi:SAM-dependent methyltransferase
MGLHERLERERLFWNRIYGGLDAKDAAIRNDVLNPAYDALRSRSHTEAFFQGLVSGFRGKRVLSVGGGIDRVAVFLARNGNDVVSVDNSDVACARTMELAALNGVGDRVRTVSCGWELADAGSGYDLAVCHDALHHMDVPAAAAKISDALKEGGEYVGMEPVCLLPQMRWIHLHLPYYPTPYLEGEIELGAAELAAVRGRFTKAEFSFHDMLSRESATHLLSWAGLGGLIRPLGRMDSALLAAVPTLALLASYVVIRARR